MKYVERTLYLDRMKSFMANGNIKIVTGIRRSGKSTLLKGLCESTNESVLRIDMELWDNHRFKDPDVLHKFIRESIDNGKYIIAIDEIQEVERWYDVVRSLVAEGDCDLYVTGSNSKLLSGEFASVLTGRYNLFNTFTLTYRECIRFANEYLDTNIDIFQRFIRIGGFPSVWRNRYDEAEAISEIGDVLNSIMMRDIVARYDIRKPDLLHRIFRFFCDNIGNRTSVHNIYTSLQAEDKKISKDLVYEYVDHLESACLIYKAETYDVKRKKILTSTYKYYLADIGLKNTMSGYRPEDIQGYVENILYLEMRARGYDIWIGDISGKEVDFICKRGNITEYIQATTSLSDGKVVEREFGSLQKIQDNYPKYVIVKDRSPFDSDMDGIKCVLLENFLKDIV